MMNGDLRRTLKLACAVVTIILVVLALVAMIAVGRVLPAVALTMLAIIILMAIYLLVLLPYAEATLNAKNDGEETEEMMSRITLIDDRGHQVFCRVDNGRVICTVVLETLFETLGILPYVSFDESDGMLAFMVTVPKDDDDGRYFMERLVVIRNHCPGGFVENLYAIVNGRRSKAAVLAMDEGDVDFEFSWQDKIVMRGDSSVFEAVMSAFSDSTLTGEDWEDAYDNTGSDLIWLYPGVGEDLSAEEDFDFVEEDD